MGDLAGSVQDMPARAVSITTLQALKTRSRHGAAGVMSASRGVELLPPRT